MSNTPRLLGAMVLAIVTFRVFYYFTVTPPQTEVLEAFNCSSCSQIMMYHECIGKRVTLTSIMSIDFAEAYMACETMLPRPPYFGLNKDVRESMNECTFCLLWSKMIEGFTSG